MNAYIIYERFFDVYGEKCLIGGIETYLLHLSGILKERGINPILIQYAEKDFVKEKDGMKFLGFRVNKRKLCKHLYQKIKKQIEADDLLIWGLDRSSVKVAHKKTIAIQHGIPFDYYQDEIKLRHIIRKIGLGHLLKMVQRKKAIQAFQNSTVKVCVDYNFWNWYRTFCLPEEEENIFVIPNFAEINSVTQKNKFSDRINILFARRFVRMRGVEIFLKVAAHYKDDERLTITFAGEGPYKNQIQALVESSSNIFITRYEAQESIKFHHQFDIAVIPSIASEGTSLSLLEAMSAGNVVICTCVGGMTNIVLDGFNGFFVKPNNSDEIIEVIEKLLKNKFLYENISHNARLTVKETFSFDRWKMKWNQVLDYVCTL